MPLYTGWANPYAASIGDEIARSADAQARAAEIIGAAQARAAEVKGNAWARVGESIGQIPAQIAAVQNQQVDRQLKQQELSMTVEQRAEAQRQRIVQGVGRLAGVTESPDQFAAAIDAQMQQGAIPADVGTHIKQQAATAAQQGPEAWGALRKQYVDFADQYTPAVKLGEGEQLVRPSVGGGAAPVAAGAPKVIDLRPGNVAAAMMPGANGAPPTLTPLASAPFAPGTGQHVVNGQLVDASGQPIGAPIPKQESPDDVALKQAQLKEINAKLAGTVPMSERDRAELGIQRDRLQAEVTHWQNADSALDQAPALTPDALDLTAKNFAMTGQLPPMGMGKQGAKVRTDIINRAADLYKGMDLASQKAAYDANKNSLAKLQTQADAVNAFEATAAKNIDLFLEQAKKVPDTGIPLLNTPARWVSGNVLGSEDMKGYEAARQSAVNEVAKVVSNPGLSGQLSDSARKEVEAFIPQSATLGQAIRVMNVLKKDMENRRTSYADQIRAIQTRIATPPGGTAPSATPPERGGGVSVTSPAGKPYGPFPDQAAADRFVADAKAKGLWK